MNCRIEQLQPQSHSKELVYRNERLDQGENRPLDIAPLKIGTPRTSISGRNLTRARFMAAADPSARLLYFGGGHNNHAATRLQTWAGRHRSGKPHPSRHRRVCTTVVHSWQKSKESVCNRSVIMYWRLAPSIPGSAYQWKIIQVDEDSHPPPLVTPKKTHSVI